MFESFLLHLQFNQREASLSQIRTLELILAQLELALLDHEVV